MDHLTITNKKDNLTITNKKDKNILLYIYMLLTHYFIDVSTVNVISFNMMVLMSGHFIIIIVIGLNL